MPHLTKSNPLLNKNTQPTGIEGNFLNLIKSIYEKPISYLIVKDLMLFPKIRNKTSISTLTTSTQYYIEGSSQSN